MTGGWEQRALWGVMLQPRPDDRLQHDADSGGCSPSKGTFFPPCCRGFPGATCPTSWHMSVCLPLRLVFSERPVLSPRRHLATCGDTSRLSHGGGWRPGLLLSPVEGTGQPAPRAVPRAIGPSPRNLHQGLPTAWDSPASSSPATQSYSLPAWSWQDPRGDEK